MLALFSAQPWQPLLLLSQAPVGPALEAAVEEQEEVDRRWLGLAQALGEKRGCKASTIGAGASTPR